MYSRNRLQVVRQIGAGAEELQEPAARVGRGLLEPVHQPHRKVADKLTLNKNRNDPSGAGPNTSGTDQPVDAIPMEEMDLWISPARNLLTAVHPEGRK